MTALRLTHVLLLAFFASFSSLKGQTQADATTGLNGLAGMPLQLTLEVGLLVVSYCFKDRDFCRCKRLYD